MTPERGGRSGAVFNPGAILRDRDGKVVGTMTLDVLGGPIKGFQVTHAT
ncbi:MAG TPA: hypothetical protein VLB29_09185 [Nocardioidaceae bacterium]|nr:hypothetical protein [Nocardioidaceae bacterium]